MKLEKITFGKEVAIGSNPTTAIVTMTHGTNAKGDRVQIVNQLNTANPVIDDHKNDFEDMKISVPDMMRLIKSQGFEIMLTVE